MPEVAPYPQRAQVRTLAEEWYREMEVVAQSGANLEQWRLDRQDEIRTMIAALFTPDGQGAFWEMFGEEVNAIRLARETDAEREQAARMAKVENDQLGLQVAIALGVLFVIIALFFAV